MTEKSIDPALVVEVIRRLSTPEARERLDQLAKESRARGRDIIESAKVDDRFLRTRVG